MGKILSIDEKIKIIDASNDLSSLTAGALPTVQADEYYFVSYSHKDYKKVYKDILLLQQAGLSIWYDRGLPPGSDWEEIAGDAITKHACAGVIFYMSENSVVSNAILKEIKFAKSKNKSFLSINISNEGEKCLSAFDTYKKLKPNANENDETYLELKNSFNERVTFIDYNTPIENKIDKIKLIKRPPLFDIAIQASGEADIISVNSVDIKKLTIPSFTVIDGVELPITTIDSCAFANCDNLTEVVLPNSIKTLGPNAFFNCTQLKSINLENVKYVGDKCFSNCKQLKSITLPHLVMINQSPFANTNLEEINVKYSDGIFNNGNYIPNKYSYDYLVVGCKNTDFSKINKIKKYALRGSNVEEMILPEGFVSVGEEGVSHSLNLKKVSFPTTLTTLEKDAFSFCKNLESVEFKNGVTKICEYAFANCDSIKKITLPNSLTELELGAFTNCKNLEEVILPNNIEVISKYAFNNCNLKTLIIPPSVTTIEGFAFKNNPNLKTVYAHSNDIYIASNAFDDDVEILYEITNDSFLNELLNKFN